MLYASVIINYRSESRKIHIRAKNCMEGSVTQTLFVSHLNKVEIDFRKAPGLTEPAVRSNGQT